MKPTNTPHPIPADCEQLAVVVRLETALRLQSMAEAKGFGSAEELLAEIARIVSRDQELSPRHFRAIADQLEGGRPARQPKAPTPQTRSSLARVVQVLRFLVTGKHNSFSIAAELECSVKTIQRDLDLIRDRLGVSVTYDHSSQALRADGVEFQDAVGNVAALGLLAGMEGAR